MKRILRAEMLSPTPVDGGNSYNTLSNRQFVIEWDGQMLLFVRGRGLAKNKREAIVPLTACKSIVMMTEADLAVEAESEAKAKKEAERIKRERETALARAAMDAEQYKASMEVVKAAEKAAREAADDTMVMRKIDGVVIEKTRAQWREFDAKKKKAAEESGNEDIFDATADEPQSE